MLYLTVLLTLTVLVYPLQIPGTKINWRRGQLQASVYAVEVTFSVECTEELTNRTKADSAVLQELLELADMGGECAVIAAAALDSKSEVRDFIEEMLVACVRRDLNNLVSDACTKIVRGRADFANAVVLSAKAIADARRSNDANAYITNAARIVSTLGGDLFTSFLIGGADPLGWIDCEGKPLPACYPACKLWGTMPGFILPLTALITKGANRSRILMTEASLNIACAPCEIALANRGQCTSAPVTNAPVVQPTSAPVTDAPVVPPTSAPTNAPVAPPTSAPVTNAPVVAPTPATLSPIVTNQANGPVGCYESGCVSPLTPLCSENGPGGYLDASTACCA
jgi:hypothetical protein